MIALAVLLTMTALYRYDNSIYRGILGIGGIEVYDTPYLDTSVLLTGWECMRQGVDVWLSNPCDVFHRTFKYSPIWAAASSIPLSGRDTAVVGWMFDLVFVLSLFFLPAVRQFRGLAIMLVAMLSPAVLLGVERGNIDIIVFVVAVAACVLAERRLGLRLIGYAAVLLAALMKYYPIMLLVLALRERRRTLLAVGGAVLIAFALFWAAYSRQFLESLEHVPTAPYTFGYFGSKNLPFQCAHIIGAVVPAAVSQPTERIVGAVLYLLLLWVCLMRCRRLLTRGGLPSVLGRLPLREWLFLVTGSAVIVGIFFAGQSVVYREVFFLMTIPGLLAIARVGTIRELRIAGLATCLLILFQMWGTALPAGLLQGMKLVGMPQPASDRFAILLWLLRELAGWWTVPILMATLADFLWRAPIGEVLVASLMGANARRAG